MREFRNARRNISMGGMGVFMRVALAIIFMFMLVVSNLMLGLIGPAFVSILFLAAFFVPVMYQAARSYMGPRRTQAEITCGIPSEARQEG